MAKYGVKPRPLKEASSSSSLSSEEDEAEIARQISEQHKQLKQVYGLNDIKERRKEKRNVQENAGKSLNSLRVVLATLRNSKPSNTNSRVNLADCSSNEAMHRSDLELELSEIKGTCSNTRLLFERHRLGSEGESSHRESQCLERSATFSNVKSLFDTTDSPIQQSPRNSGLYKQTSNRSFSNVKHVFESADSRENLPPRPSDVFNPENRNIERSASFQKFLGAFEAGKSVRHENEESDYDSSDDDSDAEYHSVAKKKYASGNAGSQKSLIQAELDEIRNITRQQSIFRINRSSRPTLNSKFGSSENLDLDAKTLQQVSSTRSAMKNMFESTAPKVTFGGAAAYGADKATPKVPQQKVASSDNSERGWMFDVINKYFDVIVEDEEESGDEAEDLEDDDDVIEEHPPVFATKVAPSHFRFPVKQSVSQVDEEDEESDYESANDDESPVFASRVTTVTKHFYGDVMEQEHAADDDDAEIESDEEENRGGSSHGYGIARSASSSKMRSLFRYLV